MGGRVVPLIKVNVLLRITAVFIPISNGLGKFLLNFVRLQLGCNQ